MCVCVPVDPGGITSERINTYNTYVILDIYRNKRARVLQSKCARQSSRSRVTELISHGKERAGVMMYWRGGLRTFWKLLITQPIRGPGHGFHTCGVCARNGCISVFCARPCLRGTAWSLYIIVVKAIECPSRAADIPRACTARSTPRASRSVVNSPIASCSSFLLTPTAAMNSPGLARASLWTRDWRIRVTVHRGWQQLRAACCGVESECELHTIKIVIR